MTFSSISPSNFKKGHFLRTVLRGAWTQLHLEMTSSSLSKFVSDFRYLAAFLNASGSKSMSPSSVKIHVYHALVISILLYASADIRRLEAFHVRCLQQLVNITWRDQETW